MAEKKVHCLHAIKNTVSSGFVPGIAESSSECTFSGRNMQSRLDFAGNLRYI
jgi:hypothetical protein